MSPKLCICQILLILGTLSVLGEAFMIPQRQQICPNGKTVKLEAAYKSSSSSPSASDAAAITEFMARAHEEKVAAMKRVEVQYKDKIAELEAKVAELEGPSTGSEKISSNSFAFPATNKALAEKVTQYQTFMSQYIVKAQAEKQKAVADAEAKLTAKYEAIIDSLQSSE